MTSRNRILGQGDGPPDTHERPDHVLRQTLDREHRSAPRGEVDHAVQAGSAPEANGAETSERFEPRRVGGFRLPEHPLRPGAARRSPSTISSCGSRTRARRRRRRRGGPPPLSSSQVLRALQAVRNLRGPPPAASSGRTKRPRRRPAGAAWPAAGGVGRAGPGLGLARGELVRSARLVALLADPLALFAAAVRPAARGARARAEVGRPHEPVVEPAADGQHPEKLAAGTGHRHDGVGRGLDHPRGRVRGDGHATARRPNSACGPWPTCGPRARRPVPGKVAAGVSRSSAAARTAGEPQPLPGRAGHNARRTVLTLPACAKAAVAAARAWPASGPPARGASTGAKLARGGCR